MEGYIKISLHCSPPDVSIKIIIDDKKHSDQLVSSACNLNKFTSQHFTFSSTDIYQKDELELPENFQSRKFFSLRFFFEFQSVEM
jgi:hypothetical protein